MELTELKKANRIVVHVFETDINNREGIEAIAPTMNAIDSVIRWSVDTEDVSNVLRVESFDLKSESIIERLNPLGCKVREMPE